MSRFLQYVFRPCDNQAIFKTKLVNANGNLILDGTLSDPYSMTVTLLTNGGTSRSISITSNGNATGSIFTITGTQNGVQIVDQVAGPNNTTVYNAAAFDIITRITVDVNPNLNISIGTGYIGYFPPILINLGKDIINYILTISSADDVPTSISATLLDVPSSNESLDFLVVTDYDVFSIKDEGADTQYSYEATIPYRYFIVKVIGTGANVNSTTKLKFIQV